MSEDTVEHLTKYLEENQELENRDINQEVANLLLDICMVYNNETPLNVFIEAAEGLSEFKSEAITALGYIGNEYAYDLMVKIIKTPDESLDIKCNTILSFRKLYSKYGNEEDLEILIELMAS